MSTLTYIKIRYTFWAVIMSFMLLILWFFALVPLSFIIIEIIINFFAVVLFFSIEEEPGENGWLIYASAITPFFNLGVFGILLIMLIIYSISVADEKIKNKLVKD